MGCGRYFHVTFECLRRVQLHLIGGLSLINSLSTCCLDSSLRQVVVTTHEGTADMAHFDIKSKSGDNSDRPVETSIAHSIDSTRLSSPSSSETTTTTSATSRTLPTARLRDEGTVPTGSTLLGNMGRLPLTALPRIGHVCQLTLKHIALGLRQRVVVPSYRIALMRLLVTSLHASGCPVQ